MMTTTMMMMMQESTEQRISHKVLSLNTG